MLVQISDCSSRLLLIFWKFRNFFVKFWKFFHFFIMSTIALLLPRKGYEAL